MHSAPSTSRDTTHDPDERLAIIGHELRGPAAALACALEVLHDTLEAGDVDASRELAAGARDAARHLEQMATALLAREQPTDTPRSTHIDLATIATASATAHRAFANRVDVTIAVDAPSTPTPGNALRMRQVVDNLVRNAIQHAPAHSTVILRTATGDDRSSATLDVIDEGPGIPDGFDPTAPWATTGRESGTGSGLGLTICADIVREHGGTIRFVAGAGGGTIVRVSLPH